ncbi:MAG TPA: S53 family peptidase [Thermomicrobiales bacterium]|nr:S53 family peptidase [Thermomicrobiales bacterium]
MRRGFLRPLFAVALFSLALLPGVALAAPPPSVTLPPQANVPVCPGPVVHGNARCFAHRRTDAGAVGKAPAPAGAVAAPNAFGNGGAYDPSYLQSAYNLAAAASSAGGGQTVAIVDAYDAPTVESDLAYYRNFFALPPCTTSNGCFHKVNQSGVAGSYPSGNSGWAQEISLDVDMVSAICPNCHILLVEANSNSLADLGTSVNTAVALGATVVSNSYGGSEYSGETNDDAAYYRHPGIPVVASTGDNGYGVQFPAASSYVTAVGGTTLNQVTNSGTRDATETAWSGAGSGCSAYFAKPSWQTDAGCAQRTVGDVAAVADPSTGVWVYYNNGWYIFGGTSVASPIVASVYALAGNTATNPAATPYASPAQLFDVVSGSNGSCGGSYLCTAGAGYDGPTGLGTPNGTAAFASAATAPQPYFTLSASPSPATVYRGSAVNYTVTLTAVNGYGDSVQLSVSGLPSRTYASFSPASVSPSSTTSTLTVQATSRAPRGNYTLTITGTGADGTRHTTNVQLTVR